MSSPNLSDQARKRLGDELDLLRRQRGTLEPGLDDFDTAGDRMDGVETLRRREEVALLDDRIAELTRLLAGGHPRGAAEHEELPSGTRVTLRYADGAEETLRAVATTEEVGAGEEDQVLTADSPLGRAIVGHDAGETVRVETPDGERDVRIVDVRTPG